MFRNTTEHIKQSKNPQAFTDHGAQAHVLAPLHQHSALQLVWGRRQDGALIYSTKVISTVLIGLAQGSHLSLVQHPLAPGRAFL